MKLSDTETLFKAFQSRDRRYDGRFFIGVKTTGIYCRPICPARPKKENLEYYATGIAAEKAGYRPCLRCRPDISPSSAMWNGTEALVRRAIKIMEKGRADGVSLLSISSKLGVTDRHLRRLFREHVGMSPIDFAVSKRLREAMHMLVHTPKPVTEIAFASGFKSIRRFNDAFKARYGQSPREARLSGSRFRAEAPAHSRAHLFGTGTADTDFKNVSQRKVDVMELNYHQWRSPMGRVHLVATDEALLVLAFDANWPKLKRRLKGRLVNRVNRVIERAMAQVEEYFSGERDKFEIKIDLKGTKFQMSAWKALQKIPYGRTKSYGEQAKAIGNPKAVRAIGLANSQNPVSIIIPCHRVIGKSGGLTGYAGGIKTKQRLLEFECSTKTTER